MTVGKDSVACDPAFGSEPWQGAISALKALEFKQPCKVTVVLSHEMIRKDDRDLARLLEFQRLQRRDRTLPGLAPECRIAGHAVFSHGHLRGREADQQPVRKQT